MRKILTTFLIFSSLLSVHAQYYMDPFKHLSLGVEAGLHGLGLEVAMPIQKHFVLKAGYNFMPSGSLFDASVSVNSESLMEAQQQYNELTGYTFTNQFGEEVVVNSALHMGISNVKAMLSWYPFVSGRFYLTGGIYYTPSAHQDTPFIRLKGETTQQDWAALKELREQTGSDDYALELKIGDETYPIYEEAGCGTLQADFKFDPLKYYMGIGMGRSIPNRVIGLQLEFGALIHQNSVLYCQGEEVKSITDAAQEFGNDAKEVFEYIDKYPIYPQLALRLNFRMF